MGKAIGKILKIMGKVSSIPIAIIFITSEYLICKIIGITALIVIAIILFNKK